MKITSELIIAVIVGYFGILLLISYLTSRKNDEKTFFTGNRKSPWYVVAFGMIGAALSGVTFVSLPGTVLTNAFHYGQFIAGNIIGYLFIAFVLIPLYYKYNLVSIYGYIDKRFGFWSYKTSAFFFLLSQSFGAALRMLLAIKVLEVIVGDELGVPLWVMAVISMILIYLYTFKAGIKTIVWTDLFQTAFLLISVFWIGIVIVNNIEGGLKGAVEVGRAKGYLNFFDWDIKSSDYFWNRLVSGFLIAIAMMGLDQNMMQKSLTIRNVREAKINTLTFSLGLGISQIFFLFLGMLLYVYTFQARLTHVEYNTYATSMMEVNQKRTIDGVEPLDIKKHKETSLFDILPRNDNGDVITDEVFPYLAVNKQLFGIVAAILFILGIVAAAFSSADSALAALTTSFCYDFLNFQEIKNKTRVKNMVHIGFSIFLLMIILYFANTGQSVFKLIFTVAGYTYAPLLALFLLGIFTKIKITDWFTPYAAIIATVSSYKVIEYIKTYYEIDLGFLSILVGAVFTVILLLLGKLLRPIKG